MGVLVGGLRSTDWMPDRESGILNGECCCGIAVGNGGRESAFGVGGGSVACYGEAR